MRGLPPIIVVGAGAAGLTTALAAAPARVDLLCRTIDGSGSASELAQGRIAAALDSADSPAAHAQDTLIAGAHHNDAAMVRWLCAQAPAAIDWLETEGVIFDRDVEGRMQLGREGGHRVARVVHAGGDASGAELVRALRERTQNAGHVRWCGGMEAEALLLRDGVACGVRARDSCGNSHEIDAAAVVLASGGIGALFARTSNPPGSDGAGLALGLAANARPRDLEFVQFHPTALDVTGSHCLPLVTEALRGAGARLRDGAGRALMDGWHPQVDLAPRDVVTRRVWQAQRDGGRVWLDASAVQGDWTRCLPTVLAASLALGIDPHHMPIPVTPAAHFHMGGLAVDQDGRTTVPGLYAVGEVACNGLHGANRLASNSLLEGVLCGRRLGSLLAAQPASPARGAAHWFEKGDSLPETERTALRNLLWDAAGPVREAAALQLALRICAAWQQDGWQARLAHLLFQAALRRGGTLGAHYRGDNATTPPPIRQRMVAPA